MNTTNTFIEFYTPGSIASMVFPRTGGVRSSFLRLAANTSTEAISAVSVSSLRICLCMNGLTIWRNGDVIFVNYSEKN